MYGSEVLFNGKEILDFERVHLSFLRNMLGVNQQTTSVTIYGDTGRYPHFLKQQILALKYWIRLISLPKSCYLRIVDNSLASLDLIGKTNWCSGHQVIIITNKPPRRLEKSQGRKCQSSHQTSKIMFD